MLRVARRIAAQFLAVCVIVGAAASAWAYEVQPMRVFLDLGAGQNSSVVTLRNIREDRLPVEIRAYKRTVAPDGTQTLDEADDDFIIFPPQVLVEPGESQAIRFQYVGNPDLEESAAYVIQIEEVAAVPEGFTGVVFAYNFGVAVYLRAPGAEEELGVTQASAEDGTLRFTVTNSGADYAFLMEKTLVIEADGARRTLSGAELADLVRNPIIPPNSERRFELEIEDLDAQDVALSLRRGRG